jgi:PAS domain S-box-containing protein
MKENIKEVINLLIVEDDEDDYVLFCDYLQDITGKNFKVQWISDFNSAVAELKKKSHQLYIFDYLLGAHTGLELISKAQEFGCEAPIILLTGKGDQLIDMEAMRLGADDYLIKGEIDAGKLERSIRYALERSDTLKALRQSEEKYRNIFERSRDMIYITDFEGNFIDLNDSATRIFGYTREEFVHLNAIDLYDRKEDRERFISTMEKTGLVSDFEVRLKDKFGEKKFCLISASIQKLNNDGKIYYQGIIHDITRRKRAERDLIIAEKLALTGRVVRTLAHEVRNPLTNINLAIEQIEDDLKNPEYQTYVEIIKRNGRRINDLIAELLQSSKPSEVKAAKHSINEIIDQTLLLAADRAVLKKIEIVKNYSHNLCELTIDREKIKVAFLNIIINAIEAMPENGGVLTISTDVKMDKCVVTIQDNGTGISKENIGKLFEPYFTVKPNGVGLGLATTHNILQSHNAGIEVESDEGSGTRFIISLNLN